EIVESVRNFLREVPVVGAAEALGGVGAQSELVRAELEHGRQALLTINDLVLIVGGLYEIEFRELPAPENRVDEPLLLAVVPHLLALPVRDVITVATPKDLIEGSLL